MSDSPEAFRDLLAPVTALCAGRPLDDALGAALNEHFPADGERVAAIRAASDAAIAAGWMCAREAGGIRYGRVLKPTPGSHGFSVDVVEMEEVAGPHHRHPNGEIDLILPHDDGARFDGHGAGWLVYGPGSAHPPTVTGGAARILYLLPDGAIEFTR